MAAAMAFSFEPMLCQSAEWPPEGHQWQYELKLDGFRAIGRKSGRSTQLWSRNHKDFVRRFPGVASALLELPGDTVIDGEVVALDKHGKPSFNLLQGFGGKRQKSSSTPSICSCCAARMCAFGRWRSAANGCVKSRSNSHLQFDIRTDSTCLCATS
jgi:ATP-dependent DNA ligase